MSLLKGRLLVVTFCYVAVGVCRPISAAEPETTIVRGCAGEGLPDFCGERDIRRLNVFVPLLFDYLGVPARAVDAGQLDSAVLDGTKLLVLPCNPKLPQGKSELVEAFVRRGGKLLVTTALAPAVSDLMGIVDVGTLRQADVRDPLLNGFRRVGAGLDGQPEYVVFSRNAPFRCMLPRLAGKGKVVAEWTGEDRARPVAPSMIMTPCGVFISYMWFRGGRREYFELFDSAVCALLESARASRADRFRARKVADAELLARMPCSQAATGEHRGLWGPPRGLFMLGHDWEADAKLMAEHGFTDFYPFMAWGGAVYTRGSRVLETSTLVDRHGDLFRECRDACHRHGIRFHARKVFWRIDEGGTASQGLRDRMAAEGRLQKDASGNVWQWLCPTDPRNRAHEVESFVEMAKMGVDGIQYDFIRFLGNYLCFCDGCRQRFEATLGNKVLNWPADVREKGPLHRQWVDFRLAAIDAVVRDVAERVRREAPGVLISAAVIEGSFFGPGEIGDLPDGLRDDIGQHTVRWCENGWIDYVCPMNYHQTVGETVDVSKRQKAKLSGTKARIYPGFAVTGWTEPGPARDAVKIAENVAAIRSFNPEGFTVYTLDERLVQALEYRPIDGQISKIIFSGKTAGVRWDRR